MSLTILSDSNIKSLLQNLTFDDLQAFQRSLRQALHEYSTGTQDEGACSIHQPTRTSLQSGNGTTTLFMPSTNSTGIGMKVVTLATPGKDASPNICPQGALTLLSSTGVPFGFLNAEEVTAFRTALASTLLVKRRGTIKTITVYGAGKQAYWHVRLTLLLRGSTIRNVNFINRTFSDRARDLLKAFYSFDPEVKEREGWANAKFTMLSPGYGEYSRLEKDQIRSADVIFTTTPSTEPLFDHTILTNNEGRKKGRLIVAIGSYKPHMIELPVELLHQATKHHGSGHHFHKHAEEGGVVVVDTLDGCLKEAGEILQSNVTPQQLVELGELVMLEELSPLPSLDLSSPTSESFTSESLSKLDLQSPGSPGLPRSSMSSVFGRENSSESDRTGNTNGGSGKSASRKSSFSKSPSRKGSLLGMGKKSGFFSNSPKSQTKEEDQLSRWLCQGNVIYKSVGMGLMDLVVGADLVNMAKEKGVGVHINEF